MRYIVRAVKYFFYCVAIVALILFVLSLAGMIGSDPEQLFVNGYDSYWQIALMFAAIAAVYPSFGYMRRMIHIPGELSEIKGPVLSAMEVKGYQLERQDGEDLVFRARSPWKRFTSMYEDRITMKRTVDGFELEGLRRDVVAVAYYVEDCVAGTDSEEQ